jgi:DNA-binding NarL/FixJ family response regulator
LRLEILERILSGQCQKVVGIELGFAPSTVALNARQALEAMGAPGKPSRAHPLLMLAAKAAREQDFSRAASSSFVSGSESELLVLSVMRPERRVSGRLPRAESSVLQHLVEGRSHAEIASLRGTSERTIANQLASIFRRLSVSGRNDLMHSLFASAAPSAVVAAAASTPPPPATVRYPRPPVGPAASNEIRASGVRLIPSLSSPLQVAPAPASPPRP